MSRRDLIRQALDAYDLLRPTGLLESALSVDCAALLLAHPTTPATVAVAKAVRAAAQTVCGSGRIKADPEVVAESVLASAVRVGRWVHDGFPTFRLTHGLTAALLLTNVADVPMSDVQFPFASFLIELPGPDFYLRACVSGRDTAVTAIHVAWSTKLAEGKEAQDVFASAFAQVLPTTTLDNLAAEVSRVLDCIDAKYKNLCVYLRLCLADRVTTRAATEMEGIHLQFTVPMGASWTVGQALANLPPLLADPRVGDDTLELNAGAERLVLNTCLYVNQQTVEPAGWGKPVRATPVRRGGENVEPRVWVFGRDIKLPPPARAAAQRILTGDRSGWHVEKRFLVRGHWRNQAYGPEHSLRRRQWIQPFWKGPQDSIEAVAHGYAVDRPEHDA